MVKEFNKKKLHLIHNPNKENWKLANEERKEFSELKEKIKNIEKGNSENDIKTGIELIKKIEINLEKLKIKTIKEEHKNLLELYYLENVILNSEFQRKLEPFGRSIKNSIIRSLNNYLSSLKKELMNEKRLKRKKDPKKSLFLKLISKKKVAKKEMKTIQDNSKIHKKQEELIKKIRNNIKNEDIIKDIFESISLFENHLENLNELIKQIDIQENNINKIVKKWKINKKLNYLYTNLNPFIKEILKNQLYIVKHFVRSEKSMAKKMKKVI